MNCYTSGADAQLDDQDVIFNKMIAEVFHPCSSFTCVGFGSKCLEYGLQKTGKQIHINIHFERAMEAKNAMILRCNQYELQDGFQWQEDC